MSGTDLWPESAQRKEEDGISEPQRLMGDGPRTRTDPGGQTGEFNVQNRPRSAFGSRRATFFTEVWTLEVSSVEDNSRVQSFVKTGGGGFVC